MKGKYVIIDLRNMDYMKDEEGKIIYYDTFFSCSNLNTSIFNFGDFFESKGKLLFFG